VSTARVGRRRRAPNDPVADLGPAIRLARGDVEVVDRPDPERPQGVSIRGARRRVAYHVLWIQGALTDEQHEAADRYLVRLEQAAGATEGSPQRITGAGGGGYDGPTERQVVALADLRAADAVLGADRQLVVLTVALNLMPAAEDVPTLGRALGRLAEYWGM
jgi:hypothetical protein